MRVRTAASLCGYLTEAEVGSHIWNTEVLVLLGYKIHLGEWKGESTQSWWNHSKEGIMGWSGVSAELSKHCCASLRRGV